MKVLLKISIIAILITLSLCLYSCATDNDTLCAYSTDYINVDRLKAQDFDIKDISEKLFSDYKYFGYDCNVSTSIQAGDYLSEKLVINNTPIPTIHKRILSDGFVIGLDQGEMGSGVLFYPNSSDSKDNIQILLSGRCVALFDTDNTHEEIYAVTSWNYWKEKEPVSLYKISRSNNSCIVKKVCDISNEYAKAAAITDDNTIYVATDQALYSVTLEGKVTKIDVPEAWYSLYFTSMVEFEQKIYIGTHCGVLRYSPDTDTFTWFPVNYENVIPK